MPLRLKPVRMKNSLYLLIPKGVSELLELDENRECILTTEKEDQNPILRYSFAVGGGAPRESRQSAPSRSHRPKSARPWEAETE